MSQSSLRASNVQKAVRALKNDLIGESGPTISSLRGYSFAILVYAPADEWEMRREVAALTDELREVGWYLHTLNMQALMMRKLREFFTEEELQDLITMEEDYVAEDGPLVGLEYIEDAVFDALHGPNGLAESIAEEIQRLAGDDEELRSRSVFFIGQLGMLYPFARTSALLKFLDGRTLGVPVVFLYPGSKVEGGLSFLDEADPDQDYRPRIYDHESLAI